MRRLLLIAAFSLAGGSVRAAVLRDMSGLVQVREAGDLRWRPAGKGPRPVASGDSIRTGFDAHALLVLEAGALVELSGNAHLMLAEDSRVGASVNILFGFARFSADGLRGREIVVRTPMAVSRARSEAVSWNVSVSGGGNSSFDVGRGTVGLEDDLGRRALLREGERLTADAAGLHEPFAVPTSAQARRDDFAGFMRRELSYELERDEPQRLVASEVRRSEQQLGRILTDAAGRRVRAEEFLVRLAPERFTFVALNDRRGDGMSWYSWTGVYDRALPRDLSAVFAALPGTVDAPSPWTLTSYVEERSDGADSLVVRASGGHQVDLNGNWDPTDDVSSLFDPSRDVFISVAGRPVYKTLFDNSSLFADGVLKRGWTGSNLQAQSDATPLALPAFTANTTFLDADGSRRVELESYADGTAISVETRASWGARLLQDAFQENVSASEFGGRAVQVIYSPRIQFVTGGLP